MSNIYKTDNRHVLPIWTDYKSFLFSIKEHGVENEPGSRLLSKLEKIEEYRILWNRFKNLPVAGDVLSAAIVLGIQEEFQDVAKFVLNHESSIALKRIANSVLGDFKSVNDLRETHSTHLSEINFNIFQHNVAKNKNLLRNNPKDPITWLELARNYSLVGEIEKAKRCIEVTLDLDHDNTYIVRSASRFFNHFLNDTSKALKVIKGSEFFKFDPLLISAEIAYSSVLNRRSSVVKIAREAIQRSDITQQKSELASSLGTFELFNGDIKEVRKLFRKAILNPNTNSLAQIIWVDNVIGNNAFSYKDKFSINSYEAYTQFYFENEQYEEALRNCYLWMQEEPYSTRPIRVASYILGIFCNENQNAISIIKQGLRVNSKDLMLKNNLVYFSVKANMIDFALDSFIKFFKQGASDASEMERITINATLGLLLYRKGLFEKGEELYKISIAKAKSIGNNYLVAMAYINYCEEELRFGRDFSKIESIYIETKEAAKKISSPDINVLMKSLEEKFAVFKKISRPN